jgi:hypothetical protein
MKRMIVALALSVFTIPAADAAVGLVQVPVACGTIEEVHTLLGVNMPKPEAIGKGDDSGGHDMVVLFTGSGYWALVTKVSADGLCVVASGHNWTVKEPRPATGF